MTTTTRHSRSRSTPWHWTRASPTDATANNPYMFDTTGSTVLTAGTEGLLRPDECFKIDAKPDWLSGYSLEFTPQNDGVTWGEIDWFGDLEYESADLRRRAMS